MDRAVGVIRRASILGAMVLAAAACDPGQVPASPALPPAITGATAMVAPATPATPAPTVAPSDTEPPTPDATEPPSGAAPGRPDPATFLQVCWSEPLAAIAPSPCSDVVEAALAAPALEGARITRVELGGQCDPPRSCGRGSARPSAWVTVLSDRAPLVVEVVLGPDGGLTARQSRPAIPPATPSFAPPAPGRADLTGAPASLLARPAYPLCGTETAPMGGPYDAAARTCFLDGVLAGSPVEFLSRSSGTEGGALVDLYRFAGSGGVDHVTRDGAAWTRIFTGIADAPGGLVFGVGGLSSGPQAVP